MKYSQHSKNTPNRLTLAVVSLLSAMALTACGGGGGGSKNTGGSSTIHNGNGGNGGMQGGNNGTDGGKDNHTPTPSQPTINELVVTTLNDVVNANDNVNSLREAVDYASKHGGTITFKDDLKGKLTLKNRININKSPKAFTIKGKGNDIKIDGNNTVRLFDIKDSTVTFDNIVLQNANIPSNNRYLYQGGAAIHAKNANLTLNKVKLLNNESLKDSGGAIYLDQGTLNISDSEFSKNKGDAGGAIYSIGNTTLTIDNSKFDHNECAANRTYNNCRGGAIAHLGRDIKINNTKFTNNTGGRLIGQNRGSSTKGGAIYLDINRGLNKKDIAQINNATITNSTFSNNSAGLSGSSSSTWGGAIMIDSYSYGQPQYTVTIKNSTFEDNTSVHGDGGAIYLSKDNTLNITGSTFTNNQAKQAKPSTADGGAIDVFSGNLTVKDSKFIGNKTFGSVTGHGGAINISTSNPFKLDKVTFKNNLAVNGGAVAITGNQKSSVITNSTFEGNNTFKKGSGGGLYVFNSGVKVKNTTFTNNSSHRGGGVYSAGTDGGEFDTVTFKNNKVTFQGGGMYYIGFKPDALTIKNITTAGNTSSYKGILSKGEGIFCGCEVLNNKGGHKFGDPNAGIK